MKLIKSILSFIEGILTLACYVAAVVLYLGYFLEKIIHTIFSLLAHASIFLIMAVGLGAGIHFFKLLGPTWQTVILTSLMYGCAFIFISIVTLYFWKREKFEKNIQHIFQR